MIQDTPIKKYKIKGHEILVKREDLACLPPGPPFAKPRGLLPVLRKLKDNNVNEVAYLETTVSMASWAISYFCQQLGMKAVIFKPVYKDKKSRNEQIFQESKWKEFGAEIIDIQATRLAINFHQAKKILHKKYPNAKMLPQGLPFHETVDEVAAQVVRHKTIFKKVQTVVSCIGSGTMAAGILKGLDQIKANPRFYGVVVAQKDLNKMSNKIHNMAGINEHGLFASGLSVTLIDAGYIYTQKEECKCPFPSNPYYDKKGWKWLLNNLGKLEPTILFWNIGQ